MQIKEHGKQFWRREQVESESMKVSSRLSIHEPSVPDFRGDFGICWTTNKCQAGKEKHSKVIASARAHLPPCANESHGKITLHAATN